MKKIEPQTKDVFEDLEASQRTQAQQVEPDAATYNLEKSNQL